VRYGLLVAASLLVVAACGGNYTNDSTQEEAVSQIAQHAIEGWADAGGAGLHDYLAISVQSHCSVAHLSEAIAGQPQPTAWKETKDIQFPSSIAATATVVFESGGQEVQQTWEFSQEDYSWRISNLPGLSECKSA
jgi:hypothetical protein